MRLDGRVALITGASRGLGRALALAFAREGASLAFCARDQEALGQVAAEVVALGTSVLAVPVDLRSTRDLDRLVALMQMTDGKPEKLIPAKDVLALK